ncbi:minor tail protein [Arthrobacter phage Timinator]|uniref:Minor tail protein n=2 Tax=Marthavirus barretlemon TaxID=2560300 RepID=A0A386KN55_9CAUD|nr:minor tail protein [Arthrobacter phage Timinator]AYD86494.1 minor tail protein [Arthrobacter phage LeeroyJ]
MARGAISRTVRTTSGSGAERTSELWRGYVAEVYSDGSVNLVVPKLGGDEPIGRYPSLVDNLAIGANVIVGAIQGRVDDLVVLSALSADGLIIGDARFTDVLIDNAPTDPHHAVTKEYADALGSIIGGNDTIVRRGASGSIIVNEAYLGNVQTANNAATRKSYVDAGDAARFEKTPTILPSTTHDLNDYIASGNYHQSLNAAANTSINYPVGLAGWLTVFNVSIFTYQWYTTYSSTTRVFWRAKYSTLAWGTWNEVSTTSHIHAAATTTVAGFMSAADKVKLDGADAKLAAAASAATASTLVIRDAAGRAQFADPSAAADAATKGYVDTGLGGKAAASHTHAQTDIVGSTTVGRAVLSAADAAAARTAIGAGTSSLAIGTTSTTAKAGNWFPSFAEVTGTIGTAQLPPLAVNEVYTVASQTAMLALTAQRGDMAIRSDNGLTYVLSSDSPGTLADWKEIMAAGQVQSVAGKSGVVLLVKADVGLSNVDNTSDLSKPISTATQTALNGKANTSHTHDAADIASGTLAAARLPAATTSAQGAMSAADKTKLDNANASYVASTLALRNSLGDLMATNFYMPASQAQSTLPQAMTRKDYVDALVADSGWVNCTITSPWVNYDAGPHATLQVRKIGNVVNIKGFLKSGSLGTNFGVVPAGYRPAEQRWFPVFFQSAAPGCTGAVLYPDGTLFFVGSGSVSYISVEYTYFI